MYSEQQPERKTALNAPIKIDADALVRAKAERAKLTVAVSPDGKALFECLHAGKTYDEESPIALAGTEARVYLRDGQWIVGIPTKLSGLPERRIPIDIEQNPDQAVYEILKNYQNWDINTEPDGKLFELMTSSNKEIFTWVNPIIIGNIAYIFYKDYKKYWDLRFPENVGDEILKIFPISEINESIDQEVMDTIAAYSLTRLRKRF